MIYWDISLYLSVGVFAVTLILTVLYYTKRISFRHLKPFYVLSIGVFISIFIAIFPLVIEDDYVIERLLIPFFNSILIFTGNREFELGALDAANYSHSVFYSGYLSVLYVLAPILSIGIVIQFFSNIFNKFQYKSFRNHKAYIFSVLNERSIITAQDIKRQENEEDSILVFMNPNNNQEDNEYYKSQANELGAIVIDSDIKDFNFGKRNAKTEILLISTDDIENITDFMSIINNNKLEKCNKDDEIDFYIFFRTEEYINIISTFIKDNKEALEGIKVITVDKIKNIIYRLLTKYPMYEGVESGRPIELLIFGDSRIMREFIRVSSWLGQMLTHDLVINVVTPDAEALEAEINFLYPEISENCEINYIENNNKNLTKAITQINPTYTVVAYQEELDNLRIGIELATEYKRKEYLDDIRKVPQIFIWNQTPNIKEQLKDLKDHKDNRYNLIPFGGLEDQYKFKNVFNSEIDSLGYKVNEFYSKMYASEENPVTKKDLDESYYNSQYNRASSIATALHNKYKLNDLENLSDEKITNMEQLQKLKAEHENDLLKLEHKRWNAFERSIGFKRLDLETLEELLKKGKLESHLSEELKLHSCLVEWDREIGNPLEEHGLSYNNIEEEEILGWLNGDVEPIDDLDRVTLTCWLFRKRGLPIKKGSEGKMEKNFKNIDKDVLGIFDQVLES